MAGDEKELTEAVKFPAWSLPELEGQGRVPLPANVGPEEAVASAPC